MKTKKNNRILPKKLIFVLLIKQKIELIIKGLLIFDIYKYLLRNQFSIFKIIIYFIDEI